MKKYIGYGLERCEEMAKFINDRNKKEKMSEDFYFPVAIMINQNRTFSMLSLNSIEFKHKLKKRPFCLVGVYGLGITGEELREDMEKTKEIYNHKMEIRRLYSKSRITMVEHEEEEEEEAI